MRRASLSLLALLAGCSLGGGEKTIDESRGDALLLRRDEVAPGFRRVFVRNLGRFRTQVGVRYERPRTHGASGPHLVQATIQLHDSHEEADTRLDTAREALREQSAWQPIDEPGVGDESFAATRVERGVRRFEVFWREANATALLSADGLDGRLALADVLALARKQEQRLARASED